MSESTVREDRHGQHDDDDVLTTTSTSGDETVDGEAGTNDAQDESAAVQQLRDKLAERGRELKESRELTSALLAKQNELIETLRSREAGSNNAEEAPDFGRYMSVLGDENATTEDAQKAFNTAIQEAMRYTEERLRKEFSTRSAEMSQRDRTRSVLEHAKRFFEKKGMPEQAQRGSDFFNYVTDEVNRGGAVAGMWSAVADDPNEVFNFIWERYKRDRGVTAPKPRTVDEHRDAVLFDQPSGLGGVGSNLEKLVDAARTKKGGDLSMDEIASLLDKANKNKRR